mmetsp:Transcript_6535/g.12938  ORF Transcript_6535/g.12938 Transcript_6535/m.12938 type:complete len:250 (+) Transcript_6535:2943-3692(+)
MNLFKVSCIFSCPPHTDSPLLFTYASRTGWIGWFTSPLIPKALTGTHSSSLHATCPILSSLFPFITPSFPHTGKPFSSRIPLSPFLVASMIVPVKQKRRLPLIGYLLYPSTRILQEPSSLVHPVKSPMSSMTTVARFRTMVSATSCNLFLSTLLSSSGITCRNLHNTICSSSLISTTVVSRSYAIRSSQNGSDVSPFTTRISSPASSSSSLLPPSSHRASFDLGPADGGGGGGPSRRWKYPVIALCFPE